MTYAAQKLRSTGYTYQRGEAPPPPNPTREGGAAASRSTPRVPVRGDNHSIVSLILQEAVRLHDAKNHDYATSGDAFANFRLSEMAGVEPWVGAVVRMGDKYARITGFAKTGRLAVTDEQVSDTLMDLLVYAAITLALYREKTSGGSEKPEPVRLS